MSSPDACLAITPPAPRATLLFAAGRGGDPERHRPLLEHLSARGLAVLAPRFAMLPTNEPTEEMLTARLDAIAAALEARDTALPLVGIGHSIGGVLLAVTGGARAYLRSGAVLSAPVQPYARLALLAPPTGYLMAPDALPPTLAPLRLHAGGADGVCPPDSIRALAARCGATVHLDEGAGHFTYMDSPPPGPPEPHPARAAFLEKLAKDLGDWALEGLPPAA